MEKQNDEDKYYDPYIKSLEYETQLMRDVSKACGINASDDAILLCSVLKFAFEESMFNYSTADGVNIPEELHNINLSLTTDRGGHDIGLGELIDEIAYKMED